MPRIAWNDNVTIIKLAEILRESKSCVGNYKKINGNQNLPHFHNSVSFFFYKIDNNLLIFPYCYDSIVETSKYSFQ